jgi:uncharacterized protein YbjQ (UPF0145 family)
MKPLLIFFALSSFLLVSACSLYSPTYFGDSYPSTATVQSYYSTKDINQPYKVIGHMTALTSTTESGQARTRQQVIEKAKTIGADGVVFSEIDVQRNQHTTDDFTIKVEVIKFKKL